MNIIKIKIKNEEIEVNLLNDFLFAKLFGEEGCERETLHLINTFTNRNFKNLSFEANEIKGEHKDNKKSVADILVSMNDSTIVNIESQIKKQKKFYKRSQFYNSRIYSLLLKVGQSHEELPLTVMINILSFNLHNLEDYHTTFILCEKNHREYALEDIIESHYIDLTKLRKKVKKDEIDLNNPKDRLALLLDVKTPQNLIEEVIEMDEVAKNIYNKTLHLSKDQKQYLEYIRADQAERDREGQLRYAKEKGIEKGIEKGLEKGLERGKEEKEVEIAINLKNKGISLEIIAETTGMSISKIKKL